MPEPAVCTLAPCTAGCPGCCPAYAPRCSCLSLCSASRIVRQCLPSCGCWCLIYLLLLQKMLDSLNQDPIFPNALLSPGRRTLRAAPAAALHLVLRMLPLDTWGRYSQVGCTHCGRAGWTRRMHGMLCHTGSHLSALKCLIFRTSTASSGRCCCASQCAALHVDNRHRAWHAGDSPHLWWLGGWRAGRSGDS